MKKIWYLSFTIIILIVFLGIGLFIPQKNINANNTWKEIGEGNLKAINENGVWKLYPTSATYLNMLGIDGKETLLLSQDVYEVEDSTVSKIPSSKTYIQTSNNYQNTIIKADNYLYDTTVKGINQNKNIIRTKNNDLIISDYENLWLVDHNNGDIKPFLNMSGYDEIKKNVESLVNLEVYNGTLIWGTNPYITENKEHILFLSNRDTVKNKIFSNSLYIADKNGNNSKLILNAEEYKDMKVLGVANDLVFVFLFDRNSIVTYNITDNTKKEIYIDGYADSLSPNGNYLLFRKISNDGIEREFNILNLTNGYQEFIGMPDGYFYNFNGAWSPDSKKYAFYLNGYYNNDETKWYRTNVKIAIIDIETNKIDIYDKPSDKSNLYTLGNISWLGNNKVICYTDKNTTWSLNLE